MASSRGDDRCRLYEALPSVLLSMNGLPTREERMSAARGARGGWARVETVHGRWRADASTQSDVAYDHHRSGLRAGMDFALGETVRVGLSVHGLRGSAEMAQVGEVDLSGTGLGAHATLSFADGFHVDVQAAETWYEANLESAHEQSGTLKKDAKGRGLALGVELGRRMAVRGGVSITPRAGFTWQEVGLDDFTDRMGSRVLVKDAGSLKGRLGVGVEHVQGDGMDGSRLFGSVDVEQELEEETEVEVVGSPVLETSAERTRFRLQAGGLHVWDEGRYSLQGSVGYTASSRDSRDLGGGLSFSMRF